MTSMIVQTQKLSKIYGSNHCVNQVDLCVQEGEIYGFLGPNGAGKTTTLKMLLGLIPPSEGTIKIFEKELNKNRAYILQHTGSLIESPSYYGHLTGLENLKIMQRLRNIPNRNVDEVLRIMRLEEQKNKKVAQYSLGMKQRIGIAMALLAFPKLLILDEPTNGLDPAGIEEIRELIKSLPERFGITVLLSSHLLTEIEQIATTIGIIDQGNLLFQGSMSSLRQQEQITISFQTGDQRKARQLIQDQGYVFDQQDNRLVFHNIADSEIAKINQLLVEHHISVHRIEEKKKSLEEIFLQLTGKERSL